MSSTHPPSPTAILVKALCRRYPSPDALKHFLGMELSRNVADLTAPGPLPHMVRAVVEEAKARGWIRELVAEAANDSPHDDDLQRLVAALRAPPAQAPAARPVGLVLLVPPRDGGFAAALHADGRVGWVVHAGTPGASPDRLAAADALVVSAAAVVSGVAEAVSSLRDRPTVLLGGGAGVRPLAPWLAESVTRIVVASGPAQAARLVVDEAAGGAAAARPGSAWAILGISRDAGVLAGRLRGEVQALISVAMEKAGVPEVAVVPGAGAHRTSLAFPLGTSPPAVMDVVDALRAMLDERNAGRDPQERLRIAVAVHDAQEPRSYGEALALADTPLIAKVLANTPGSAMVVAASEAWRGRGLRRDDTYSHVRSAGVVFWMAVPGRSTLPGLSPVDTVLTGAQASDTRAGGRRCGDHTVTFRDDQHGDDWRTR